MTALPTGTVTFLFTDLEGSTRLWELYPGAMKDALARHDAILRDAVAARDGVVVKMTGDGVHAAFADAAHAVLAAIDAQRALSTENWDNIAALAVRMGIHTGPAEARDGDYYGTAVNRAARLMSAATGGQVLLSLASEEHLRDAPIDDFDVVDLGEIRLRDLSRPERVFQLDAPGLVREFPPLQSLDDFPTNLPIQVTSFVGRERDIEAVADALTKWRLVTIVGVGGVGKTRLAMQVAAEVLPRYSAGAWLCELAAAADADTMAQVVAATLGVNGRTGMTLQQSIVEALRARELLIVLDNCEHLMEAAGQLAEALLLECRDVVILATSREGLAVPGEQVRPLRSLPAPVGTAPAAVEVSEAVRLFVERAQSARPDFVITDANSAAVAEICRRLDGIPLAIELASARVASMSPAEITGFLDERFRLLTGGRRTSVERHQTLRATVDWSYSLLDEASRLVFDRLGVFAGSFDNRAAEAVVTRDGIERWDVLDALADLAAKSMVTIEETDAGVTRYQLLETLRQYARERLDERGDSDVWRRRLALYYVEFVAELAEGVRGVDEVVWRARMRDELDNIRAAVIWGLDRQDDEDAALALALIAELGYEVVGDRTVGVGTWALRAAERARSAPPPVRAAVLGTAAAELALFANDERARSMAIEALADDEPFDCPVRGVATFALSLLDAYAGRADEATRRMEELIAVLDADNADLWIRTGWRTALTSFAAMAGATDRARSHAETALRLARQAGSPTNVGNALWALGFAIEHDDPDAARAAFEECVVIGRQVPFPSFDMARAHLASLRARAGEAHEAACLFRECITDGDESGLRTSVLSMIALVVASLAALGRPEPAATLAGALSASLLGDLRSFTPHEIAEQERALARIGDAIGSDRTEAALARGRALSYEQAVEFALRELDEIIANTDV
jgi:predicted ATPase/class 3 adenylate cyclase